MMRIVLVGWMLVTAVALAACGSADDANGAAVGGIGLPITVDQLPTGSYGTPITVRGFLHIEDGIARLCGAILESYPPQCGQPSVELIGLDVSTLGGTTTAGNVTWKEGVVLRVLAAPDGRYTVVGSGGEASVHVTLGLYSGVPDPSWTLTDEEAAALTDALVELPRTDAAAPERGLGYHGFTITVPSGTLVAYAGKVSSALTDPSYTLDDPDRTIERLLLETASAHVTPDEYDIVAEIVIGS
jgi:hypothetical protein